MLDDISNQLHLCAALMSDPFIMETQPAVVAAQFFSAFHQIERLRLFLNKPPEVCKCGNWLGASVLDRVKRLVDTTLRKQMGTLTIKEFPEVFREFAPAPAAAAPAAAARADAAPAAAAEGQAPAAAPAPAPNHSTEREIRESNCVGAMLLLYYYLHWHILLILVNRQSYPCTVSEGKDSKSSIENDPDWKMFLDHKLPRETQMLELRAFEPMLKLNDNATLITRLEDHPIMTRYMSDADDGIKGSIFQKNKTHFRVPARAGAA